MMRATSALVTGLLLCLNAGCQGDEPKAPAAAKQTQPEAAPVGPMRVYVGTFTWGKSKGIYTMQMDPSTGALTAPDVAAELPSPSFFVLHPTLPVMYTVNEVDNFNGGKTGGVTAFRYDAGSGKLTKLNQQPSGGGGPTHITIDRDGKAVLVANYGTGSVALLPVGADGKLAEPSSIDQHQEAGNPKPPAPHAHSVNVDPANRFVLSADLGLDRIYVYRLDTEKGKLTPNDPPFATTPQGTGPRHLAFHTSGKFVYAINEMADSVTAFRYDAEHGTLESLQTVSALADDFTGDKSGAEILVHPSGKFLYCSNRGKANSVTLFTIDQQTGKIARGRITPTQGKAPRGLAIDPSGHFLVAGNQDSDNVLVFRIDPATGVPEPTGNSINVPAPVSITFIPGTK